MVASCALCPGSTTQPILTLNIDEPGSYYVLIEGHMHHQLSSYSLQLQSSVACDSPTGMPSVLPTYGNFDGILDHFPRSLQLYKPYSAACGDILGAHADRVLIGACNPMLQPIHHVLHSG